MTEYTTMTVHSRVDVNERLENIDGEWEMVDADWFKEAIKPGGSLRLVETRKVGGSELVARFWESV